MHHDAHRKDSSRVNASNTTPSSRHPRRSQAIDTQNVGGHARSCGQYRRHYQRAQAWPASPPSHSRPRVPRRAYAKREGTPPQPLALTLARLSLRSQKFCGAEGRRDASALPSNLLQRSAAWARAEVNVELLRCGHATRCPSAYCGQHSATTIVRYLDGRGRPLHAIVEQCDGHGEQIKRQGPVRDLRGFP